MRPADHRLKVIYLLSCGLLILSACHSPDLVITAAPLPGAHSTMPTATADKVCTSVDGAVQHPGDYTLPAGARVVDAVHAAGGPSTDADLAQINLAQTLSTGGRIHVPRVGEVVPTATPFGLCADGRLNINQADVALLQTLPKIGPVTAQHIVEYRTLHGPFQNIEQIQAVKGIGPATLAQIEALITVGERISPADP